MAFSGRRSQQPQPAAMQPVYHLPQSAPDHTQACVELPMLLFIILVSYPGHSSKGAAWIRGYYSTSVAQFEMHNDVSGLSSAIGGMHLLVL